MSFCGWTKDESSWWGLLWTVAFVSLAVRCFTLMDFHRSRSRKQLMKSHFE